MRLIHLAAMDKTRPVLILTRAQVRLYLNAITIAPITSTVRGLSTEVPVGQANGLDHGIRSSPVTTSRPSRRAAIGRHLGYLQPAQEHALDQAIAAAYDLDL